GFRVKELLGGIDWWRRDGHPVTASHAPGSLLAAAELPGICSRPPYCQVITVSAHIGVFNPARIWRAPLMSHPQCWAAPLVTPAVLGEPLADAIGRARASSRSNFPQQVLLLRHRHRPLSVLCVRFYPLGCSLPGNLQA